MVGHGAKFGRKKEEAILALLQSRTIEEAAAPEAASILWTPPNVVEKIRSPFESTAKGPVVDVSVRMMPYPGEFHGL